MRALRSTLALATAALLAAGCPAQSKGPGAHGDAGPGGAGDDAGSDAGGTCTPQPSCPFTFRYPAGNATTVELRGDFAAGAWDSGVPLTLDPSGEFFTAQVDLQRGQSVQYKFVVNGAWVTDPDNPDTADDGVGGKNSVVTNQCESCGQDPYDWQDGTLYFVFVDRFVNGDTSNDDPENGVATPANYQGGDLAGVKQKIDDGYFNDLGVNALWLTAPYDNADAPGQGDDGRAYSAYHGYWPSDLDKVEPRLGTLDDLKAVVDAAHAHGLKVFLDYVMNHVSDESPVYAQHPDWFWPINKDDGTYCLCGAGCGWNGADGRRCWFRPYLPDFNFENPDARAWSVDNAVGWARKTGIDGFRLDAVKQIETQWIVDLRARLTSEIDPTRNQSFYMVGETFDGNRGLIGSYVNPRTMLDGQFDFPLRAQIASNILRREGSMADLAGFLDSNDRAYVPGAVMGTFLGNHDLPRAIHIAEDTPEFGPWDGGKDRGWDNTPVLPDYDRPFQRIAVAYALLMTTRGMPLIYYGDEIGMAGGGDPDNRRPMQWDGLTANQAWLKQRITALLHIRAAHPALRRGFRRTLSAAGDVYVYEMLGRDEVVYVALNRGDQDVAADGLPAGSYRDLLSDETVTVSGAPGAPLGPRSARILVRQ